MFGNLFTCGVVIKYVTLNDIGQDYAWVRRGMIFPFADFLDRSVDCFFS